MAVTPIGSQSITGISSGLDTQSLVEAIIQSERRNARLLEARQLERTSMITAYQAIQAKFLAVQASISNLASGTVFSRSKAESSDKDFLTVTAGSDASVGSYTVRVLQLAKNHQLASQGFSDPIGTTVGTGTFKIAIGQASLQTITVDATNNTLTGLKDAINNANVGVTASIINDGSYANKYRLVLVANDAGEQNKITTEISLIGGTAPNFTTASFEAPETNTFSSAATSVATLGSSASFTGTQNKIYAFTVQGTGTKTIGTDVITLNWTDGTNSGSVVVSQADTEVTLSGAGADGLTLQFSAGTLVGGEKLKVQSFAPTLQNSSDGKISVGSSDGSGSPIEIISTTNTYNDAISGVALTAKKTHGAGESVNVTAGRDTEAIKREIENFISAYNEVITAVDKQFSYNVATKEAGALIHEAVLSAMQTSFRGSATGAVGGLDKKLNLLSALGIRSQADGKLKLVDSATLDRQLEKNPAGLRKLFAASAVSNKNAIEFMSLTDATIGGKSYNVDITTAATSGNYTAQAITSLSLSAPLVLDSTNNSLILKLDGLTSSLITLAAGSYTSGTQLAKEIQTRANADANLAGKGLKVSWVEGSGSGFLKFESSTFGSTSSIEALTEISETQSDGSKKVTATATARQILGLLNATKVDGVNVAGTINGEAATGFGRILTGNSLNKNTEGLKLEINLSSSQLVEGVDGVVTVTKGVGSRMRTTLNSIVDGAKGSLSLRVRGLNNEVNDLKAQIKAIDGRLEKRRESLLQKFTQMEETLGQLNSQSAFLTSSLGSLQSNFIRR